MSGGGSAPGCDSGSGSDCGSEAEYGGQGSDTDESHTEEEEEDDEKEDSGDELSDAHNARETSFTEGRDKRGSLNGSKRQRVHAGGDEGDGRCGVKESGGISAARAAGSPGDQADVDEAVLPRKSSPGQVDEENLECPPGRKCLIFAQHK